MLAATNIWQELCGSLSVKRGAQLVTGLTCDRLVVIWQEVVRSRARAAPRHRAPAPAPLCAALRHPRRAGRLAIPS